MKQSPINGTVLGDGDHLAGAQTEHVGSGVLLLFVCKGDNGGVSLSDALQREQFKRWLVEESMLAKDAEDGVEVGVFRGCPRWIDKSFR